MLDPIPYDALKLGILQIGYKRNKNGYKFTEIDDKFDLFLAARRIWDNEVSQKQPSAKDYPVSIKITTAEPQAAEPSTINEMHKKVSVRGDFAKVGEDIRDGEVIIINDAGTVISGEYGERTAFKVETHNGEKVLSFNQSSINNFIEAYGEDSEKWVGKDVKAWVVKTMVSGKLRNVVYLAHPDWHMLDDGTFVPPKSAATRVEIDASEEAADEDYEAF